MRKARLRITLFKPDQTATLCFTNSNHIGHCDFLPTVDKIVKVLSAK